MNALSTAAMAASIVTTALTSAWDKISVRSCIGSGPSSGANGHHHRAYRSRWTMSLPHRTDGGDAVCAGANARRRLVDVDTTEREEREPGRSLPALAEEGDSSRRRLSDGGEYGRQESGRGSFPAGSLDVFDGMSRQRDERSTAEKGSGF